MFVYHMLPICICSSKQQYTDNTVIKSYNQYFPSTLVNSSSQPKLCITGKLKIWEKPRKHEIHFANYDYYYQLVLTCSDGPFFPCKGAKSL